MAETEVFHVAELKVCVTHSDDEEHARIDFEGEIEGWPRSENHPGLLEFLQNATYKDGHVIPNLEVHFEKVSISGKKVKFTKDIIKHLQHERTKVLFYFSPSRPHMMFHKLIKEAHELQIAHYVDAKLIEPQITVSAS